MCYLCYLSEYFEVKLKLGFSLSEEKVIISKFFLEKTTVQKRKIIPSTLSVAQLFPEWLIQPCVAGMSVSIFPFPEEPGPFSFVAWIATFLIPTDKKPCVWLSISDSLLGQHC